MINQGFIELVDETTYKCVALRPFTVFYTYSVTDNLIRMYKHISDTSSGSNIYPFLSYTSTGVVIGSTPARIAVNDPIWFAAFRNKEYGWKYIQFYIIAEDE